MGFIYEERLSDSPYIESITHGYTADTGSTIRPAEIHWHMVFVKFGSSFHPLMVGPLLASGIVSYVEGAEILWLKFKLGTFMPHLPIRNFLDVETALPEATGKKFWLKGSAWQIPSYENADTFIDRLVRDELLVRDPVVDAVLQGQQPEIAPRTVRHRFLQTTGLSYNHILQYERAQRAAELLRQGMPILDAVYDAGYYDQPHLTRSLKQFIGYTPAQLVRLSEEAG